MCRLGCVNSRPRPQSRNLALIFWLSSEYRRNFSLVFCSRGLRGRGECIVDVDDDCLGHGWHLVLDDDDHDGLEHGLVFDKMRTLDELLSCLTIPRHNHTEKMRAFGY